MKQDVLETLEFDKLREKRAEPAPSHLSKAMARTLMPAVEPEIIEKKLTETEEASILLEREITTPLGETHDITETLEKAGKDMILMAKEFIDLAATLETYKKMHHYFEGERHLVYPALEELASLIIPQEQLIARIHQVFDEHGEVSDRASPRLSRIRTEKEMIKNRIRKTIQQIIQDKDQSSYFQDAIVTQRNGRYVVPVKEEYRYKFEGIVHDRSSTGQTLFMEPMVSVRLNNDLAELTASEKQEVQEIVDFLKNPKKYTDLGGKIPKGALLVGPPGTGKTLLAKAVAGEAGVPFFSMSGSDFVEMFVGVGASRVRDLFRQAKEKSPSIIFIDEIDAVGRARSKNPAMGGNDERENTLNALLTEMDGFGTNSGVIILAATNRVDMLDSALLRAGRFDREIHVDLPGLNERKAIFLVHLKPIKIDETVDVDLLARQTPGFSGADIANVCNEAALIAARHDKKAVCKQDFLDAVDRIVGGLEKKTKVMTADEKRSIALHEAGHATISWFCQYANPLIKVTIVPRGQALGAAWYLPEERQITTKEQMLDEMCSLMGGRAAEELFTGHISSGAMNDLERATKSAYGMVAYLGMSKTLPNICFYNRNEYSFQRPYSETTAREIDEEVLKMVNEQYTRAKNILMEHKEGHNALAELLIQKEVIMAEDVEHIFGKRPWLSRSQEIMEDEQPKIDDAVKELPEVQAAIKEHEAAKKNADDSEETPENESDKENPSENNNGKNNE